MRESKQKPTTHFWHSATMEREAPKWAALMYPPQVALRNFAIIDGREVVFTVQDEDPEWVKKNVRHADLVYLGVGVYSRSEAMR